MILGLLVPLLKTITTDHVAIGGGRGENIPSSPEWATVSARQKSVGLSKRARPGSPQRERRWGREPKGRTRSIVTSSRSSSGRP